MHRMALPFEPKADDLCIVEGEPAAEDLCEHRATLEARGEGSTGPSLFPSLKQPLPLPDSEAFPNFEPWSSIRRCSPTP